MALKGQGMKRNVKLAIDFLAKASENEFSEAQKALGYLYLRGTDGVKKSIPDAREYFTQACENGDETSCQEVDKLK